MVQAIRVDLPQSSKIQFTGQQRTKAVGVAVGNHAIKLTSDSKDYVIRSQSLTEFPDQVTPTDERIFAKAVDTGLFSGRLAIGNGLAHCNGVKTLGHGLKGKLYAPYALIAIANSVDNGDQVSVALSLPTSKMKAALEPLKGIHTLVINGKRKIISITHIRFYPEGRAAAYQLRQMRADKGLSNPSFVCIDVGGGNFSVVLLDEAGNVQNFTQTTPGVHALYSDIASAIAEERGGLAPNIDAVAQGVEANTLRLGGYGEIDFSGIYQEKIAKWFDTRLSELRDKAGSMIDQGAVKVLCGGGSLLPDLKPLLPSGYVLASNPLSLESQGLYSFAKRGV